MPMKAISGEKLLRRSLNMLPNRISLSQKATDKLRYIKSKTGLTPNILSRIAIMLAIKEGNNLQNAGVNDYEGQILSRDVLFGDYQELYSVLINQHLADKQIEMNPSEAITALIEIGVFKMGHVKNLVDIAKL